MRRKIEVRENYKFLLSGLLTLLLIVPSVRTFPSLVENASLARTAELVGFSVMMLIGVWSLQRKSKLFHLGLVLAILNTLFAIAGSMLTDSRLLDLGAGILVLIFAVISGYVAAKHVFTSSRVDRNILYGGVCVYLLIGVVWALIYDLISELVPGAFQGLQIVDGKIPFDNFIYYSFVTLPSLGYGDIAPVAPLARTFAYLEAVTGQFYIAILVAGLVGMYMRDRGLN